MEVQKARPLFAPSALRVGWEHIASFAVRDRSVIQLQLLLVRANRATATETWISGSQGVAIAAPGSVSGARDTRPAGSATNASRATMGTPQVVQDVFPASAMDRVPLAGIVDNLTGSARVERTWSATCARSVCLDTGTSTGRRVVATILFSIIINIANIKINKKIHSAAGCDPCNCDPIGSLSNECDLRTGACRCRPGVAGEQFLRRQA